LKTSVKIYLSIYTPNLKPTVTKFKQTATVSRLLLRRAFRCLDGWSIFEAQKQSRCLEVIVLTGKINI